MTEHRHFHRIYFDCLVEFDAGGIINICELLDISLNGALIAACTGATPAMGTPCQLVVSLDDDKQVQIVMNGTIAHKLENRVGIHCTSIDMDSMMHLRKLVEANLGDSELANRDFAHLQYEH